MIIVFMFLIGMGLIYPAIAFAMWFIKYRKSISLKEFWANV